MLWRFPVYFKEHQQPIKGSHVRILLANQMALRVFPGQSIFTREMSRYLRDKQLMSLTIFVIYDLFYHLRLENVLRRKTNSQELSLYVKIKKVTLPPF